MKRTIFALASASVVFISSLAAADQLLNVKVTNTPLPVAVVNGGAAQAVNVLRLVDVLSGSPVVSSMVYQNSGTSDVVFSNLNINAAPVSCDRNLTFAEFSVRGEEPPSGFVTKSLFSGGIIKTTIRANVGPVCGYSFTLPGGVTLGPGDELWVTIFAEMSAPAVLTYVSGSGYTMP